MTSYGCRGLWHWNQSAIIPMEATEEPKPKKAHRMWRFSSLFSSIAMAWCIMNFCHKVVRSIRNTIFKLCGVCVKAPAHISMLVREFLAKNEAEIMPQLPYSPNAPTDYFLFPKLKKPMKGKRFDTIEEIKEKSKPELLSKTPKSAFQKYFENRKKG